MEESGGLYDNVLTLLLLCVIVTMLSARIKKRIMRIIAISAIIIFPMSYHILPLLRYSGDVADLVWIIMMVVVYLYPFWFLAMGLGFFLSWFGGRHLSR
jgi:hypothetical protein